MITGSVSSSPVNTTVQVVVLPLPSSAVMVMLCVVPSPDAISVPANGDWVISTEASQLSVATASATRLGTVIWQLPFNDSVRSAGQVVITGSVSSSPVNTTVQVSCVAIAVIGRDGDVMCSSFTRCDQRSG